MRRGSLLFWRLSSQWTVRHVRWLAASIRTHVSGCETENSLALSEAVKWVMENEGYAEMFDCSHPLSTKMIVRTALDVKGQLNIRLYFMFPVQYMEPLS